MTSKATVLIVAFFVDLDDLIVQIHTKDLIA